MKPQQSNKGHSMKIILPLVSAVCLAFSVQASVHSSILTRVEELPPTYSQVVKGKGHSILDTISQEELRQFGFLLLYLAAAIFGQHAEVVEFLLTNGADPNIQTKKGFLPLFWAIGRGNPFLVFLLLEVKADPNIKSQLGFTPLHVAVAKRVTHSAVIVELLVSYGARADIQAPIVKEGKVIGYGATALEKAEELEFDDLAQIIKEVV